MKPEQQQKLREPFAADLIGKLPKPTRADNQKGKCNECGGWHGLPAVHLDYVGHAAVTDRLLQVDPEWTWRPMARDDHGVPVVANGGLWIELTVAGVTRPGWGDGKNVKEMIGDALRNAAMRFGVALDLWSKEDLDAGAVDRPINGGAAGAEKPPAAAPDAPWRAALGESVVLAARAHKMPVEKVTAFAEHKAGKRLVELSEAEAIALKGTLDRWAANADEDAA